MESRCDFGEYLGSPKKRSIAVVQGSQRSPKVVFGERLVSAKSCLSTRLDNSNPNMHHQARQDPVVALKP